MQGGRGGSDPFFGYSDPFAGFGSNMSIMPNIFGGRDPFDDPFFARPFAGMFQSNLFGPRGSPFMDAHAVGSSLFGPRGSSFMDAHAFGSIPFGPIGSPFMDAHAVGSGLFGPNGSRFAGADAPGFIDHQPSQPNTSRGPIIEELDSDDEKEGAEGQEKKENLRKHGRAEREPYVEVPDDEADGRRSKHIHYGNELSIMNNTQPRPQAHSLTFQSSTVTYGGANGAYYTSSTTKRTGSDGLTFEEHKEADSVTRQAAHRRSRGIYDKGHTVTRKLNSDGQVDTMQMLHNINEDELAGFDEAWKGNTKKHLPGWTGGVNVHEGSVGNAQNRLPSSGGWALPSTERSHVGIIRPNMGNYAAFSHPQHAGEMRTNAGERAESSNGRSGAAYTSKMGFRRH